MKKIWLALLACMTFICVALATTSCSFGEQQKTAFNECYLEEIVLGEPIMLDEYVNPELTDDYTLILTCDETQQERDLKKLGQWTTDYPGVYTLTYTVNSGEYKGTISTKINVIIPEATWQYSRPILAFRAGDTMEFSYLKRMLNLMVKSYYPYEFFVKTVMFDGERTDVSDSNNYTFPQEGEYTFTFAVKTEDGQELTADQTISVRPQQVLAEGAEEWMKENNITAYDYTYIAPDGTVSLDAGYYNTIIKDNVPYIAFNGENGEGYGDNTYMMVDFTGKNLPQVAFFCDEVTSSYTDGKNGILVTNGITNNAGTDYFRDALNMSRLTIFGPYKVNFPEFDNRGRLLADGSVADPIPMAYHALSATDSYRYIVGIEDANSASVTIRILLINLTTYERVFDYKNTLTSSSGNGALKDLDLTDYYKGSIVLYGRYGLRSQFDKVYMPITDIDDIYELDEAAPFKSSYKKQYNLNAKANVSDYIDIPESEYEFKVFAPNGEEVAVAADGTFAYTMSGKYRLYFDPKQENVRPSSISVRVMYDLENEVPADYYEKEGVFISFEDTGVKTNDNKKFVNEGSYSVFNYSMNGKYETISVYVSKSFMDFVYLASEVRGISFEVYSNIAVTYKLKPVSAKTPVAQDYTGEIAAETWTTITLSRELMMRNYDIYKSASFSIAVEFVPTEGEKFHKQEGIYLDNVQLLLSDPQISNGAEKWMEENNVIIHGVDSFDKNLQVEMQAGSYSKEWYNLENDDLAYIGYQGNYGANSYVVADFTGKNVPQMAFFVENITASLTDGEQGVYVHTGMIKKTGALVSDTDGGRITFFGPNKMVYCRPDADGRVGLQYGAKAWDPTGAIKDSTGTPSPLSIRGLEDGVHYRYVAGIKSAAAGKIVLELLLINLDTKTEVVHYEVNISGNWITDEYLSHANIVMYGRFNEAITLDKVYAVYENIGTVYAIDKVAEAIG